MSNLRNSGGVVASARIPWIEEGYVSAHDDPFIRIHVREVVLHIAKIFGPDLAAISRALRPTVRTHSRKALVVDIIENDEVYAGRIERRRCWVRRSGERSRPRGVVVVGHEVQVVIAFHAVPGEPAERIHRIVGRVEVEQTPNKVATGDAKGHIVPTKARNGRARIPFQMLQVDRLGVARHEDAEIIRFLLEIKRKIDACRQGTGGRDPFEEEIGVGTALRPVQVIRAGEVVFVQGHAVPAWFDHMKNALVANWQPVAPFLIGLHNILAIGNPHTRNTGLPDCLATPVEVQKKTRPCAHVLACPCEAAAGFP